MKIGIFGGTFDPIHNGHRDIATAAKEEYSLDELWFMPAGDPYCKSGNTVTDARLRYEMTELMVSELSEGFRCSDLEIRMKGKTYTANTLGCLTERYPEHDFYFILGADSLMNIESWYHPDEIFKNAVILCAARPGSDLKLLERIKRLNESYGNGEERVRLIHLEESKLSSTDIREMCQRGGDISPYVSKKVLDFIEETGLYKPKDI